MTLAEFLLARIAEDEAKAKAAGDFPWYVGNAGLLWEVAIGTSPDDDRAVVIADALSQQTAEHIARWDPVRILADCAAKRRLVVETQKFDSDPQYDAFGAETTYEHAVLSHLALPYADHPDYRDEWRP